MGEYYKDPHKYDDIIDLPHYVSLDRPQMSLYDRAAQFAPFAALNGYETKIKETIDQQRDMWSKEYDGNPLDQTDEFDK